MDWICSRLPLGRMLDPTDKQGRTDAGHSHTAVTTSQVQKLLADSIQAFGDSILAMFGNGLEQWLCYERVEQREEDLSQPSQEAGCASVCTFRQYYDKPLRKDGRFGAAVLDMGP